MKFISALRFLLYPAIILLVFSGCHQDKSVNDGGFLTIPDPKTLQESYVSNPDKILSESTVAELNATLSSLDKSGRAHIDVVAVSTIGEAVPKDAATQLFKKWKIGSKETNNGLLILLVKDQHRIEFETGYGLEGDLPDLVCYRIQQKYMIPHARNNDFDLAVKDGVNEVIAVLNPDRAVAAADGIPVKSDTVEVVSGNDIVPPAESIRDTSVHGLQLGLATDADLAQQGDSSANPAAGAETAQSRETGEEKPHTLGTYFTALIFFAFMVLMRSLDKRYNGARYKSRLLSPVFWLTCMMPALLVVYLNWFHYIEYYDVRALVIFYIVAALYTNIYFLIVRRRFKASQKDKTRHEQCNELVDQRSDFKLTAFLCPLPWLWFFYRQLGTQISHMRNDTYPCETCGSAMKKLDEFDDDLCLEKGQVAEEQLHSVDYDVWECTKDKSHKKRILDYENPDSTASKCPECEFYTLTLTKSRMEVPATRSSSGWGWRFKNCRNCNHEVKTKYTIPKIASPSSSGSSSSSSSSSSGSSSSSSSSSGSSSGGSSGGGGAGSSW